MRLEVLEFSTGITLPCVQVTEYLLSGTDCTMRQCYVCEFCISSLSLQNKSECDLLFKEMLINYKK